MANNHHFIGLNDFLFEEIRCLYVVFQADLQVTEIQNKNSYFSTTFK